jgi:uncharacterized protein YaaN involved in tellurite resistance
MLEELQKQIIAIQIIQELIVDVMDKNDIIERSEFEKLLEQRVKKLNKQLDTLNEQIKEEKQYDINNYFNPIVGEA